MVFSSFTFLFFFLPCFIAVYLAAPGRLKNLVALLGSYVFYLWGAPKILPLLIASCLIDYFLSHTFSSNYYSRKTQKIFLVLGLFLNVLLLAYYKYANFFVSELNSLTGMLGLSELPWKEVLLPIGVSFFTFQKISYLLDVYSNRTKPAQNPIDHLLYVALFPQLVAGPIVRYHDIAEQIKFRKHTLDDISYGIFRFCIGLGKKILIADEMGKVANNVFNFSDGSPGTLYLWLGLVAYAWQIYFDFSAYSDMAIGLGRMLGFKFLENFSMPYISRNITEFWRRWHISLSNWMREYLYIPLGGNRSSSSKTYFNLWVVFLFSGLWHGASWNFIVWGMFHGAFLSFDRLLWLKYSRALPSFINILFTFFIILMSWVLFRSENLTDAISSYQSLFDFSPNALIAETVYPAQIIHYRGICVFIIATSLVFLPAFSKIEKFAKKIEATKVSAPACYARCLLAITLFILAVLNLSSNDFSPFLYFRF